MLKKSMTSDSAEEEGETELHSAFENCIPGTMHLDDPQAWLIDGKKLSAQEFVDYRRSCTKRGLHVGSDPKYREMSRMAVKKLLQKQFDMAQ